MIERMFQVRWSETLPMRPRRENVAAAVTEVVKRAVRQRARIVRLDDRVIAIGGGDLVEIDVGRPSDEWQVRPSPVDFTSGNSADGPPLMVGFRGEVFELQADLSLRTLWKSGISSALPVPGGSMLLHPTRRIVFGNWLAGPDGNVRWRIRSESYAEIALDDVILSVVNGRELECRSTDTGEVRWVRDNGSPEVVVDDTVWVVDGTCLVACGLERGEERARIELRTVGVALRVDEHACGHAFSSGRYWTIDLRTARVLTKYEIIDPPRDMYTVLPLEDGLLVRTSEHALYRLEPRDGKGTLPAPLWRSPVLISETVPFQNGLIVKTDGPREQAVHWLAPNG